MLLESNKDDFFPRGLALGDNFCNREEEQGRLLNNIQTNSVTLVVAPRRYGKTSLVMNVLHQYEIPFAFIDLYAEIDEEGIANSILSGIGDVLYKLESVPKKALKLVTDFFSGLSISFNFKETQVKVTFPGSNKVPSKLVLTTLQELDRFLKKKKRTVVLFLDEFQRVNEVTKSVAIEGSLRNIAQQTNSISFIFSGSNRHLLNQMFNDRTKPFYNLCDKILLNRIEATSYSPFIQKKAKKKWKKLLEESTLDEIFTLTQQHPYYLNVLCHRLWSQKEKPNVATVLSAWEQYVLEEKSQIKAELDLLSKNQAKMLIALAKYGTKYQPSSKEFLSLTNFSSSSALQALKKLQAADYVFINKENKYCLLDPVIAFLFA